MNPKIIWMKHEIIWMKHKIICMKPKNNMEIGEGV